jgi:quercetin dioxygenase-like cupin family protein
MDDSRDAVEFDELVLLAMAEAVPAAVPRPEVKQRLMDRLREVPHGFSFDWESSRAWRPHPVPGIRMKVLAEDTTRGYVTLLLDVAPGARYPAHHHDGAEECYVISGSLYACGQRMGPGDFLHADPGTDHGELWTEEGCRVLLIVSPETP